MSMSWIDQADGIDTFTALCACGACAKQTCTRLELSVDSELDRADMFLGDEEIVLSTDQLKALRKFLKRHK